MNKLLEEEVLVIRKMMNLCEQIPDSRFEGGATMASLRSRNNSKDLTTLGIDDLIDVISAAIDGIPGIGNLVSAGIDISHALSYFVRFYFSDNEDDKIENVTLGFVTLGATFIPVAGNSLPIMARQGIKQVLRNTPSEILLIAKRHGLYDRSVIFLSKTRWKWCLLLFLAKVIGQELMEFLTYITKQLNEIYNKIKNISLLKDAATAVLFLIKELGDMKNDVDIAINLAKTGSI